MRLDGGKTYRVLLLLHLKHCPVLECPLDEIRFGRCARDNLALGEFCPESVEVLQFYQMPDLS